VAVISNLTKMIKSNENKEIFYRHSPSMFIEAPNILHNIAQSKDGIVLAVGSTCWLGN
jgi:hypothetical protein